MICFYYLYRTLLDIIKNNTTSIWKTVNNIPNNKNYKIKIIPWLLLKINNIVWPPPQTITN